MVENDVLKATSGVVYSLHIKLNDSHIYFKVLGKNFKNPGTLHSASISVFEGTFSTRVAQTSVCGVQRRQYVGYSNKRKKGKYPLQQKQNLQTVKFPLS